MSPPDKITARCIYQQAESIEDNTGPHKEKEAREMKLKKQKLEKMGQVPKPEKQEKEKEEPPKKEDGAAMDTNNMPTLISHSNDDGNVKGVKKKFVSKKNHQTPQEKVTLCSFGEVTPSLCISET